MQAIWSVLWSGGLLLGVVIFVHELGHFLAAKWRGVRVLRFSLGFGPAMAKVQRGETEYRVSWFPLGGYVQMAGDSPGEDGSLPSGGPGEFLSHPWPGRLLIAVAGPAANLLTAFVVVVLTYWVVGVTYYDYPSLLGATPDTSRAFAAGFRSGDRVLSVNGERVESWLQVFKASERQPRRAPLRLEVERDRDRLVLTVAPEAREPVLSSLRLPAQQPVVGSVATGMPAYRAGLKEGDRILAVNGRPVSAWDQLSPSLRGQVDRVVTLRVRRGAREFDVPVVPIHMDGNPDPRSALIGIEPPRRLTYVERYGPLVSLVEGARGTARVVATVYRGMWLTVSRPLYYREYLGGPLFIAQAASDAAHHGLDNYLYFLALINCAIMAFNLLPIPILDGGHITLALLEAVRRQALSARAYLRFQRVGLVVMVTLFLLILANDPWRVIQRQRAIERASRPTPQEKTVAPSPP